MYIEDIVTKLSFNFSINLKSWDSVFINSLSDQIHKGFSLTEKQANILLKVLKKNKTEINAAFNQDISQFIENPQFKLTKRTLNHQKQMEIIDDSEFHKVVKVQFPYSEDTIQEIRQNRQKIDFARWDKDEKAWIFPLTEKNLLFLSNFHAGKGFEISESLQLLFSNIESVIKNIENYVPMLVLVDDKPKIKNCSNFCPDLPTDDILEALFEARKRGIFTWDEKISDFLSSNNVKTVTKSFLKTEIDQKLHIDCEKTDFYEIFDLVDNLQPCLIVIPGGSELEKLSMAHENLKKFGIEDCDMSVLFRLPNETDKKFNDFVKNNGLNNSIHDFTKIVFISSKIPKPMIKSKIKFNLVINLGFGNVHYSIRNLLANHENLVYYSEKINKKDDQFWLELE